MGTLAEARSACILLHMHMSVFLFALDSKTSQFKVLHMYIYAYQNQLIHTLTHRIPLMRTAEAGALTLSEFNSIQFQIDFM